MVWCGVMVSVLASSVIDHRFEPDRFKPKTLKLIFVASPLSTQHYSLRTRSRDWLAWNQDDMSEWGDMSISRLLFQWASTIKHPTQRVGLVSPTNWISSTLVCHWFYVTHTFLHYDITSSLHKSWGKPLLPKTLRWNSMNCWLLSIVDFLWL